MPEIVIGRTDSDIEKYGTEGTIFIGKQYIRMAETMSLANKVLLDVVRPHVILVAGKRGGGKSYTLAQIAEGVADLSPEIAQNIACLFLDTMGIFWTMKEPNYRDEALLKKWKMEPKALTNVRLFVPYGKFDELKDKGIPADEPFSIATSDLDPIEWAMVLGISPTSTVGVSISRVITRLKKRDVEYDVDDIIKETEKDEEIDEKTKASMAARFEAVKEWGLFTKEGTPIEKIIEGGIASVLDISVYTHVYGGFSLRALIVGLFAKKVLEQREIVRRVEEKEEIEKGFAYFERAELRKKKIPMVWIFLDEAHEFLPREGETLATGSLLQLVREGRQPGISMVFATQQPGKIHTDVLTQSDMVISHRITSRIDIEALNTIMQTYMATTLGKALDELPRVRGCALILDENQERVYSVQMRPRFSWHGGETPTAIPPKAKEI